MEQSRKGYFCPDLCLSRRRKRIPLDCPTEAAGDAAHDIDIASYLAAEHLEVDANQLDQDSALNGISTPSTESVSSDLYEHIVENGRTYHRYKEGKYPLPNDELEQDRLDFQHKLYKLSLDGRLFAAPISPNPKSVLDVATGTGIWAIEFAEQFPKCNVIGTDLSPIQPAMCPPNVRFEIADAEDEWSFAPSSFDFVHLRAVLTCFRSPRSVFAQAFQTLAPGGYIQLRDPIMPFKFFTPPPPDCAFARWNDLLMQASARVGRRWDNAQHYSAWLNELGFVAVVETHELATLNPWATSRRLKYLSLWVQQDLMHAVDSMSLALFTRVLGWDMEDLQPFLEQVKADIKNTNIHTYSESVLVWGRKPLSGETA